MRQRRKGRFFLRASPPLTKDARTSRRSHRCVSVCLCLVVTDPNAVSPCACEPISAKQSRGAVPSQAIHAALAAVGFLVVGVIITVVIKVKARRKRQWSAIFDRRLDQPVTLVGWSRRNEATGSFCFAERAPTIVLPQEDNIELIETTVNGMLRGGVAVEPAVSVIGMDLHGENGLAQAAHEDRESLDEEGSVNLAGTIVDAQFCRFAVSVEGMERRGENDVAQAAHVDGELAGEKDSVASTGMDLDGENELLQTAYLDRESLDEEGSVKLAGTIVDAQFCRVAVSANGMDRHGENDVAQASHLAHEEELYREESIELAGTVVDAQFSQFDTIDRPSVSIVQPEQCHNGNIVELSVSAQDTVLGQDCLCPDCTDLALCQRLNSSDSTVDNRTDPTLHSPADSTPSSSGVSEADPAFIARNAHGAEAAKFDCASEIV